MTKPSPAKIFCFVLLLLASLTIVTGASVRAAQTDPPLQVDPADGDLMDPSIPPLTGGAPAGPKPSDRSPIPARDAGTFFQDSPNAPAINVWYGPVQTFGPNGDPQKWVNIMGNVTPVATLTDLTYTLNGGASRSLDWGDNGNRLIQAGDFNIDLDYTDLLPGDNTLVITATDNTAASTIANVTVKYQAGPAWTPGTYVTNWAAATKVNDVAQVVDGLWVIDSGKARPTVSGFDRLVTIGDLSWRDYTVTVPVTVHSMDTNKSPAIGVIVRWQGHFDDGTGKQPFVGWRRLGALGWYRYQSGPTPTEGLQLLGHAGRVLGEKPFTLTTGVTYIYKISVTSDPNPTKPATYRFKIWNAAGAEPAAWDFEAQGRAGEPRNGSLVLVAHNANASFGNVTVNLVSTEPKPELTLGTSGTGTGTVTPNPQKTSYLFGEDVALTAAPAIGSTFSGWQGDATGTANPVKVEMFGDRSVKAVFVDPNVQTPISDDFSSCELDDQLWTYINPLGDSTLTMTGAQAQISVPAGSAHDIWTSGRNAPRVMQLANNENFEFDVKFDSSMSQKNQAQGVLVEADDENFLRFNFLHDGAAYRIQVYTFLNGASTKVTDQPITISAPMYLRTKRVLSGANDVWNLYYSDDGTSWTFAAGFQFAMTVTSYGAYVGNSSQNPAFVGQIDYLFKTNSPISPEDNDRKLNITTTGSGSVQPSPAKDNYGCDEEVSLTPIPAQGFKFDSWSGDLSGTDNPATLVMNETKDVTANFVPDVQYQIFLSPVGSGEVNKSPDKTFYSAGEQVTLTATADLGHLFVNWGGDVTGSVNPITVTVNQDMTVTGNFTAAPPRTLTVTPVGNGTVGKSPDSTTYLNGQGVTLTPMPGANASFVSWGGDATGADDPLIVIMDGDKNITANFADNIYTLTISPDPNGVVTPDPQKTAYYQDEVVLLTPTAFAGYKFTGWGGDLSGAAVPGQLIMTKNSTVTANFVIDDTFTVNVVASGPGSVSKFPVKTEYDYGDEVTLTATPDTGNEFTGWSGDLTDDTNPITLTVTSDLNITGNFAGEGVYDLVILPPTNGTVNPFPVRDLYAQNELVTLTAVPNLGYMFVGWGNDASGLTNPLPITMTGDITVSAAFDTAPLYDLNLTSSGPGSASVVPAGTEFFAGTMVTLTATAQSGYVFTGWTDDLTSNNNPYLLTIDGNKNIVANFSEASAARSDDFDGCAGLNPMWTWSDSLGLADYALNGQQVVITVPPEANYETSRKFHKAAQITQPVANTDFSVLVRFDSTLSQQYQFQGIVIQEDANNLIRVETSYDDTGVRFSAVSFEDGDGKARKSVNIGLTGGNITMLVRRTGDIFKMYYRVLDSDKWIGIGNFSHPINVEEVGFFASSYGPTGTPAPGHTAMFDYFFNETAPIDPEDAGTPGLSVTTVGQGTVTRTPTGDDYACGQSVALTAVPAQGWQFQNWSGDLSGSAAGQSLVISRNHSVTATFVQVQDVSSKLYLPVAIR